jgi:TonB family protein
MIAPWMIYIFLISVGVAVAAGVFERALRATPLPARLIWAVAIFLPILAAVWSGWHWWVPGQHPVVASGEISHDATQRDQVRIGTLRQWAPRQLTVAVSPDYASARFDSTLLAIWLGGSLLTLAAFGGGAMRLRRIRSSGELRNIGGVRVAVTASTGPLVIGVIRPEIILPAWVLDLDRSEQELVIAHEQEHVRGCDPALLALAAVAVAAAPWNPLLWYMLRRIREAVELDCDRRVLGVHPDARAYAGLLLSVASRNETNLLPVAGLAASVSSLEQRFRFMTMNAKHHSGYRLISTIAVVALLLVATAMIPRPIRGVIARARPTQSPARATGRVNVTSPSGSVMYRVYATGGTFTEMGKPARAKADTLIESVSESRAGDVFDIDVTNGDVHFVAENTTGIHVEAAMSGQSRKLWLSATSPHIVIQRGGVGVLNQDLPQPINPATTTFFEYQVDKPATLRASVKPRYPAALKSSGVRGEVWVQYVVDETGRVDMRTFKSLKSSAPEFTAAVKDVLPKWRLDPAVRQGRKVKQLVEQAFVFTLPPHA